MSLDLYLEGPARQVGCKCSACGHAHEAPFTPTYFSTNTTHNLSRMFEVAGVYKILWHGTGLNAGEQIVHLIEALRQMKADPARFDKFSAPNGWGTYVQAVPWLESVIAAFIEYPDTVLRCSR